MACVEFLRGALAAHNPDEIIMETAPRTRGKSDSGYVMARWGTPKVLLNVHIDTVPSGEGWTSDPLEMRREGGRIIGLGTSDIKGAAACILGAMEQIKPKVFTGKGGHSSLSDVTERPLLQAARLASAWGDYGDVHRGFGNDPYKGLCLNIGDIENDGAYNVIPTRSKLWASMRPPPGDNVAKRRADMLKIAQDVTPEAVMDTIVAFEPFESQNPEAFKSVFEDTPIVDLPYFYGPGDVEQAHKPNEYVSEAHLITAAAAYARALSGADL